MYNCHVLQILNDEDGEDKRMLSEYIFLFSFILAQLSFRLSLSFNIQSYNNNAALGLFDLLC